MTTVINIILCIETFLFFFIALISLMMDGNFGKRAQVIGCKISEWIYSTLQKIIDKF